MNDAVLESVTCGNTQVDSRNARIVFNRMSKPDAKTGQTGFIDQFTVSKRTAKCNIIVPFIRYYSRYHKDQMK